MLYPSAPDYTFKYQKIWLSAVMKDGLLIPITFKKDTAYKCRCVDNTYSRPDPSCKLCYGTGYNNQQEIENKKWVAALSAPLDKETIQKYSLGNFTKSSRMLLVSYPVSPQFTKLYEIKSNINLKDADGTTINANLGYIMHPEDQEAKISYKEKLYDGNKWIATEKEFHILAVESYIVSEYPIGQKLILQETSVEASNKRFIPEIPRD
jgi:hypothetical protein